MTTEILVIPETVSIAEALEQVGGQRDHSDVETIFVVNDFERHQLLIPVEQTKASSRHGECS